MCSVDELNRRFGIEGLRFEERAPGFIVAVVENRHAGATIAMQGAHLMAWQPSGQAPVIWMSPEAKFAPGKSIRGGVPICWPWFGAHAGDGALPPHGYARTTLWQLLEAEAGAQGHRLVFALRECESSIAMWPHRTPVRVELAIGRSLTISLVTRNDDPVPVILGEALHTYFAVSDIEAVRVTGLEGLTYADKVEDFARKRQEGAVTIAEEVDRVYLDSHADCLIEDPGFKRRIRIAKEGSRSTIVWNPWAEKAAGMGDLGERGYRHMLCVESGNALDDVIALPPGAEHRLCVTYSVEGT